MPWPFRLHEDPKVSRERAGERARTRKKFLISGYYGPRHEMRATTS